MFSSELIELLKKYITQQQPVGPANAEQISNIKVAKVLFDTENKIYESFISNPTIIIGRRGAGKTAYLKSSLFSPNYNFAIEIPTPKLFNQIVEKIQKIAHGVIFPENTAEVWELALTLSFFREILLRAPNGCKFNKTKNYLAKIGLEEREYNNVEDFLWDVINIIEKNHQGKPIGTLLQVVKYCDNVSFDDAKKEVEECLKEKNIKSIALIDSLDEFNICTSEFTHALSGLMKCVGSFNVPEKLFDIRFCLPAELYHEFMDISSNPLKDFERHVTLHWHSSELLSIVSHRLKIYSLLYNAEIFQKINVLNPNKKDEAREIFYTFFPRKVKNSLGFKEDTLAYIIRHTQLIPRQFILYLNTILSYNNRKGGAINDISNEAIIEGIKQAEQIIRNEVFSAFKCVYPDAKDIYNRCIPELPLMFDYGQLQKIFTQFGKKVAVEGDFFEFKKMLVRIGCIGRVYAESDRYIEGIFDYSREHQLTVSSDDYMCLHPIYSCKVNCKVKRNSPKAIYPYGSDIDAEDNRNFS